MKWIGVARASRFSLAMTLALLGASQPAAADERPTSAPSAGLKIEQLQIVFVASGTLGGGTLYYQGRSYPVKIGGLGIGGVGASRLAASGKVYGLTPLDDFPGAYTEIRSGWALGERGKGRNMAT